MQTTSDTFPKVDREKFNKLKAQIGQSFFLLLKSMDKKNFMSVVKFMDYMVNHNEKMCDKFAEIYTAFLQFRSEVGEDKLKWTHSTFYYGITHQAMEDVYESEFDPVQWEIKFQPTRGGASTLCPVPGFFFKLPSFFPNKNVSNQIKNWLDSQFVKFIKTCQECHGKNQNLPVIQKEESLIIVDPLTKELQKNVDEIKSIEANDQLELASSDTIGDHEANDVLRAMTKSVKTDCYGPAIGQKRRGKALTGSAQKRLKEE